MLYNRHQGYLREYGNISYTVVMHVLRQVVATLNSYYENVDVVGIFL